MHRNGIQLSGSNEQIMDKDPRPVIESLGITIIETPSLHDAEGLFKAYQEARALARKGRPSMIYPVGYQSSGSDKVDLNWFGAKYGITAEVSAYAEKNGVTMDKEVWVPGALMSYRDLECMLDCLFLVNNLPGGQGHHDGSLKGRDVNDVLANPMLQLSAEDQAVLTDLAGKPPLEVTTKARPAAGSPNLVLPDDVVNAVSLPEAGKKTSARAGVQVGYEAIAKSFPDDTFVLDCDLAPSTKVDKARNALAADHQFELSIEEQIAAIMANGLACSTSDPQFTVFGTFAAFFEGIAREGFEMWRYQRNLNGVNEGLNVTFHLSHVGACTGRDHFSGWSLDWISLAIGYLPYLHRVYAPADARSAFVAIKDAAAHYGGHIVCIPRDNLPVLSKQDGSALWDATDAWEAVTPFRKNEGAKKAILAFGAPAFVAEEAAERLTAEGTPTDVYIINGLPVSTETLEGFAASYPDGLVTIEDGLIGTPEVGLRGFANLVSGVVRDKAPVAHVGITDPRIAPSEGHMEVWDFFGITADNLVAQVTSL